MQPLVSIIVPVYGVEQYIERCAHSIFSQTYQHLEIIFIDDCSKDKSIETLNDVLSKYPDRKQQTKIIRHEHNLGLAGARLTGITMATGYFLMQIDSDDYIALDMVEKMVDSAQKEKADITICDFNYVYKNKIVHKSVNPPLDNIKCLNAILTGFVHASVCNKLIKRSLYVDNKILPTIGLNMWEDLSVMYKLMYHAEKVAYIPLPLYNYVLCNQGSYTAQKMPLKYQFNAYQLITQMRGFMNELPVVSNEVYNSFICRFAYLEALIVLYGDVSDLSKNDKLFQGVTLKVALTHPSMDFIQKVALVCKLLNFRIGLSILKFGQSLKHKLYH